MLRYLKSTFLLFSIFIFLIPLYVIAAERPYDIKTDARVVVFGDVHGAYDELVSLLKETGIINSNLNWAGGESHLVSLGDLIDRGPRSRDVLELMIKLQTQALKSGGEVHVLLGNHELMAMIGDRRYITQADYTTFAKDETFKERDNLRLEYLTDHNSEDDTDLNKEFNKLYPPGFVALDKAFDAEGYIGRWILDQPLILKINNTVFVHGGIPSEIVKKSLKEINEQGKTELKTYLKAVERLRKAAVLPRYIDYYDRVPYLNKKAKKLIDADPEINTNLDKRPAWFNDVLDLFEAQKAGIFTSKGPLWYRGTSKCHIYCESFNTERFLKNVTAERVVIGHTPTGNHQAVERMDGLVIRLDTGILKDYYKGQASALILEKKALHVHYQGNTNKIIPMQEQRSLSRKLSGMSDSELEDFLRTGEITETKRIGTGITRPMKVTLKKGDKTINAVFKTRDTNPGIQHYKGYNNRRNKDADRYVYDVAAYHLDRLMDLQMVPTAVLREINGKEGVIQYWVENTINERDRLKSKIEFEGYCKKKEQYWLRFIFDILIYNEDRNLTNILWTKDDFSLIFIDHSRAFRIADDRSKQYRKAPLNISDLLRKKLNNLNSENLTMKLSPYLHPKQISAILKRRDLILEKGKRTDRTLK